MRFVFWLKGGVVSDGLYVVINAFTDYKPITFLYSCGIHFVAIEEYINWSLKSAEFFMVCISAFDYLILQDKKCMNQVSQETMRC